jgi:hypothetical protein
MMYEGSTAPIPRFAGGNRLLTVAQLADCREIDRRPDADHPADFIKKPPAGDRPRKSGSQ